MIVKKPNHNKWKKKVHTIWCHCYESRENTNLDRQKSDQWLSGLEVKDKERGNTKGHPNLDDWDLPNCVDGGDDFMGGRTCQNLSNSTF